MHKNANEIRLPERIYDLQLSWMIANLLEQHGRRGNTIAIVLRDLKGQSPIWSDFVICIEEGMMLLPAADDRSERWFVDRANKDGAEVFESDNGHTYFDSRWYFRCLFGDRVAGSHNRTLKNAVLLRLKQIAAKLDEKQPRKTAKNKNRKNTDR